MNKAGTKKSFMKKMSAMQKALAQAQAKMNNPKCNSACQQPGQGGEKGQGAGMGSDESINMESNSLEAGFDSQIQGQKGAGPSEKQVESAASGTGVSYGGDGPKKKIEHKKQMESFIEREDIPETMKNGVKEYFKRIHE